MAYDEPEQVLVVGTDGGRVFMRSDQDGVWRRLPIQNDGSDILAIVIQPDEHLLVAGDEYGGYHTWTWHNGQYGRYEKGVAAELGYPGLVGLAIDRGGTVAAVDREGTVVLDLLNSQGRARTLPGKVGASSVEEYGHATTLSFSLDSHLLATVGRTGMPHVWNLHTDKAVQVPRTGWATAVAFSPTDPAQLAIGDEDGVLWLWDAGSDPDSAVTRYGHVGGINSLAFNPAGDLLVTSGDDHTLRLWTAG